MECYVFRMQNGPYMRLDDGRVVSNFIKAVLDKTEITIQVFVDQLIWEILLK